MPMKMSGIGNNSNDLGKLDRSALSRSVAVVLIAIAGLVAFGNTRAQSTDSTSQAQQLNNVDIHSLIETVSRRTGKNFIVDPRVNASITAMLPTALEGDQLYELFLSILDVHGFAAVPAGSFIKIVPAAAAVQGAVPVLGDQGGAGDELVTRVIPVVNVPAQQMIAVLRPLLAETASLSAETNSNTLIITDRAANINRLEKIIQSLDHRDQ